MIAAFARWEEIETVAQLHVQMRNAGLRPNNVTYSTLIVAYGRVGDVEMAEELYAEGCSELRAQSEALRNSLVLAMSLAGCPRSRSLL